MAIIETVLERKTQDGKTMWIAVIDGKEVMAWDAKVLEFKGKECPYPIIKTKSGKDMIQFPKEGGGKSGGGWKGKSDKEIYLGALTMAMAYAKDLTVAGMNTNRIEPEVDVLELCLKTYQRMSKAILADLKAIEGEVPKQEAPKAPEKPPVVPRDKEYSGYQAPAPPKPPVDPANMTIKQKLEYEIWAYLRNTHSDSDDNFRTLLMDITSFTGKDGKPVYAEAIEKISDKWAQSALGKLRELVEEEERKSIANADLGKDINF